MGSEVDPLAEVLLFNGKDPTDSAVEHVPDQRVLASRAVARGHREEARAPKIRKMKKIFPWSPYVFNNFSSRNDQNLSFFQQKLQFFK
jgi:hypothetical protein